MTWVGWYIVIAAALQTMGYIALIGRPREYTRGGAVAVLIGNGILVAAVLAIGTGHA